MGGSGGLFYDKKADKKVYLFGWLILINCKTYNHLIIITIIYLLI